MALWQYHGEFIPELWLIAEHGRIPSVLEGYLITDDTDLDTLEDPHYWGEFVVPDDLIQRVRSIMPARDSWSDEALMFGDEQGSD